MNFDGRMLRHQHYKYVHSVVYGEEYHILFDLENDPDIVAMVATSAALTISGIPFMGPIGAARVGVLHA